MLFLKGQLTYKNILPVQVVLLLFAENKIYRRDDYWYGNDMRPVVWRK